MGRMDVYYQDSQRLPGTDSGGGRTFLNNTRSLPSGTHGFLNAVEIVAVWKVEVKG